MTDTVNIPEVFDRSKRRIVRDRAYTRAGGDDFLSQIMVEEILERLDVVKRTFRRALIIGIAAGRLGRELQTRGMKVFFADSSARAATVNDLPGALVLCRRILVPDGLLLAAMIGAESFPSLKSLIMEAEGDRVSAHIHPQVDVRTAGDLLSRVGLTIPVADSDNLQLNYSSLGRLLSDIRDVGGSNIMASNHSAIGRKVYNRMQNLFSALRNCHLNISLRLGPSSRPTETSATRQWTGLSEDDAFRRQGEIDGELGRSKKVV